MTTSLDVLIGGVTLAGSLVAAGKLAGRIPGRPITFAGGRLVNLVLVDNELYSNPKTAMLFGDAKASLSALMVGLHAYVA